MSHMDCKYCLRAIPHTHAQHGEQKWRPSKIHPDVQKGIVFILITSIALFVAITTVAYA